MKSWWSVTLTWRRQERLLLQGVRHVGFLGKRTEDKNKNKREGRWKRMKETILIMVVRCHEFSRRGARGLSVAEFLLLTCSSGHSFSAAGIMLWLHVTRCCLCLLKVNYEIFFFFLISVCTVLLLTLPRPSHSGGVKTCSVCLWKDNVHCLCSKSGNCSWCSWSCLEVCACLSTGCAVTAIRKTEMQYWRLNDWTSHCLPTHTHTPQPSESLKEILMWQEAWIWQHGMT